MPSSGAPVRDLQPCVHSRNLSLLDYVLQGCLKDRIYAKNLHTTDALKINIPTEIIIPHEVVERVIANFNSQVATIIQRQAAWMEHTY